MILYCCSMSERTAYDRFSNVRDRSPSAPMQRTSLETTRRLLCRCVANTSTTRKVRNRRTDNYCTVRTYYCCTVINRQSPRAAILLCNKIKPQPEARRTELPTHMEHATQEPGAGPSTSLRSPTSIVFVYPVGASTHPTSFPRLVCHIDSRCRRVRRCRSRSLFGSTPACLTEPASALSSTS